MQKSFLLVFIIMFISCNKEKPIQKLEQGIYRAVLEVQDNEKLPFTFEVESSSTLTIYNAEEVIEDNEITYRNDSIFINSFKIE